MHISVLYVPEWPLVCVIIIFRWSNFVWYFVISISLFFSFIEIRKLSNLVLYDNKSHTFSFFLMLLRFSLFLWNSLFCIITFSVKSFMISLELLSSGFAPWTTFCKLRQTNFTGSARRSLSASEHMRPPVTAGINCNRKTMLHMVGFLQS